MKLPGSEVKQHVFRLSPVVSEPCGKSSSPEWHQAYLSLIKKPQVPGKSWT